MDARKLLGIVALSLVQVSWAAGGVNAADKVFSILEIEVAGNSLLATEEVENAVTPYLGESKSIKDVEAARQSLEKLYHERGFQTVLVNIPQQAVAAGVVRLDVLEAPVGQLQILGSRYHSLRVIRATMPDLRSGVVPNFGEVQKQLARVNRSQDLRVTPVLRASTTPGKVDVDLQVKDQLPLHATFETNNRYGANTTRLRLIGMLSYENLFQRNQSLSVQYQTAPQRTADAKIWSLSYVIPTRGSLLWALYAIRSDSDIAAVGDLAVIGKGKIFGIRAIKALSSASSSFYHSFTAGADYKDFKQDLVLQGADTLASPVHYPPVTLQYAATWLGPMTPSSEARAATSGGRSGTTLDLGLSFLLRGLGTNSRQFAVKRAGAGPSYLTFRPGLERQQVLAHAWSAVAKLDAQLASGPLISSEQYGAGGADSVRGYTETERLGDDGVRAALELRTPQLLAQHSARIEQSYLFAFAEGARVRIDEPLPKQQDQFHLASVGLGFRFKASGLLLDASAARTASAGYVTKAGSYSGQFRLNFVW
jgi:hemolysin activation/secretion protein